MDCVFWIEKKSRYCVLSVSLPRATQPHLVDQEFRDIHAKWLEQKEEEQGFTMGTGEGNVEVTEKVTSVEVSPNEAGIAETPAAFVPRDLPVTPIDISPSVLQDVVSSSETFISIQAATASSPTSTIATISDLTPTDLLDEDTGVGNEWILTRHKTFYLEDGNVEIVCGQTLFRVHSPIVSFSSPKLRDLLSPATLLDASMPEGCPRVTFTDTAVDFVILLKMIYTPG